MESNLRLLNLIIKAKEGDINAKGLLFKELINYFNYWVNRNGIKSLNEEDIKQDLYIKFDIAFKNYNPDKMAFFPYFKYIIMNTFNNSKFKYQTVKTNRKSDKITIKKSDDYEYDIYEEEATVPGTVKKIDINIARKAIAKVMSQLSESNQLIINLRIVHNKTFQQIKDIMDIGTKFGTQDKYNRAIKRLYKIIENNPNFAFLRDIYK